VVRTLRKLAALGHTVIVTVHRPRWDAFMLFDDAMVVASGHVLCKGSLPLSVPYFAAQLGMRVGGRVAVAGLLVDAVAARQETRAEEAASAPSGERCAARPHSVDRDRAASPRPERGSTASADETAHSASMDRLGMAFRGWERAQREERLAHALRSGAKRVGVADAGDRQGGAAHDGEERGEEARDYVLRRWEQLMLLLWRVLRSSLRLYEVPISLFVTVVVIVICLLARSDAQLGDSPSSGDIFNAAMFVFFGLTVMSRLTMSQSPLVVEVGNVTRFEQQPRACAIPVLSLAMVRNGALQSVATVASIGLVRMLVFEADAREAALPHAAAAHPQRWRAAGHCGARVCCRSPRAGDRSVQCVFRAHGAVERHSGCARRSAGGGALAVLRAPGTVLLLGSRHGRVSRRRAQAVSGGGATWNGVCGPLDGTRAAGGGAGRVARRGDTDDVALCARGQELCERRIERAD